MIMCLASWMDPQLLSKPALEFVIFSEVEMKEKLKPQAAASLLDLLHVKHKIMVDPNPI